MTAEDCRRARLAAGWNEEALAFRSGITKRTIRNFESGRHRPREETLIRLRRAFREAGRGDEAP